MVIAAIDRAGLPGEALELEITESVIMADIESNSERLQKVSDYGVTIAIDDFGTGYSSLRYLAKLPVDTLKIDRSFIVSMASDDDSMTLVSTIISLAHSFRLNIHAAMMLSTSDSSKMRTMLPRASSSSLARAGTCIAPRLPGWLDTQRLGNERFTRSDDCTVD